MGRLAIVKLGKLNEEELVDLLGRIDTDDPSIVLGPKFGEDAGAVLLGGEQLVAASDPVTFASEEIGWYAVHINANDIAATGADPRWFLATVLLPETSDRSLPEKIFSQVGEACGQLSVSVLGGHTEVTPGLSRPIVCGTMIGTTGSSGVIATGGAHDGDVIILTKGICIEGAALLALERGGEARKVLGAERWERARGFLRTPGLSVVADARIARETVRVHALHDPTEGGLSMGLYELAAASGLGLRVEEDDIPVLEEARDLCAHFGLDVMRTLASGALLVCVAKEDAEKLLAAYQRKGVRAAAIGRMTSGGCRLYRKGLEYPLLHGEGDEITKIFGRGA